MSSFNDMNEQIDVLPLTNLDLINFSQNYTGGKKKKDLASFIGLNYLTENTQQSKSTASDRSVNTKQINSGGDMHITVPAIYVTATDSTKREESKTAKNYQQVEESNERDSSNTFSDKSTSDEEQCSNTWSSVSKRSKGNRLRKRSKTIGNLTKLDKTETQELSFSDSEVYKKDEAAKRCVLMKGKNFSNIVVVIDNSNIFIGARESACNANPRLRPRQVKLRLHQLAQVIENNRKRTRGITGVSSPPANEHVWDVYR